jgi:hypothetical protein
MSFSIVGIIRRLIAPKHELSCSRLLWRRLVASLRERGEENHESGAFLLGHSRDGGARIMDFVLYDDLDPHSLDTGIVRFDGRYFGKLWELCTNRGLTVVADVHTHPADPQQSHSDRAHPMIALPGHIALILPRFATEPLLRTDIGVYRYNGNRTWETIPRHRRESFFYIGI